VSRHGTRHGGFGMASETDIKRQSHFKKFRSGEWQYPTLTGERGTSKPVSVRVQRERGPNVNPEGPITAMLHIASREYSKYSNRAELSLREYKSTDFIATRRAEFFKKIIDLGNTLRTLLRQETMNEFMNKPRPQQHRAKKMKLIKAAKSSSILERAMRYVR
jgi:hypothetical protein